VFLLTGSGSVQSTFRNRRFIKGTIKQISEGTIPGWSYRGVVTIAKTNPSEDAGFPMLKTHKIDTTKVRFHTIMFMKESTGQYRISIWHAGDGTL
jgi:hypothetical protein